MQTPSAQHLSFEVLEAGLPYVQQAPTDFGRLGWIVRRPAVDAREVLQAGWLDVQVGLVGDSWQSRPSSRMPDRSPHPDMQLNIMNLRAIALLAPHPERWQWAGDQLYLDLDLSEANLPVGTRLAIGAAVVVVTAQPHLGCSKFATRFGTDALRLVNSPVGRALRLRGLNARVLQAGAIQVGDSVCKWAA
jgi:hypothetical protein